jgi:hypothetical protein
VAYRRGTVTHHFLKMNNCANGLNETYWCLLTFSRCSL